MDNSILPYIDIVGNQSPVVAPDDSYKAALSRKATIDLSNGKGNSDQYADLIIKSFWALSNMCATSQVTIDIVHKTKGKIMEQLLEFIKVVQVSEYGSTYSTLLHEASYLVSILITEARE